MTGQDRGRDPIPGRALQDRYLEAARRGDVLITDVLGGFIAVWRQLNAKDPPQAVITEASQAADAAAARRVFAEFLNVELENPAEVVQLAEAADQLAEDRARLRVETIGRLSEFNAEEAQEAENLLFTEDVEARALELADDPGAMQDFLADQRFKAMERQVKEFSIPEVEAELDKQIGAVSFDEPGDSITASLFEDVIADAPEAPEEFDRLLPFSLPTGISPAVDEAGVPLFDPVGVFEPGRVPGERGAQARGAREGRREFKLRYRQGTEWGMAAWDPIRRVIVKDTMIKAGFLDPDEAASGGTWAFAEASGMRALMEDSNATGVTWQSHLDRVAANPSLAAIERAKGRLGAAGRAPFVAPPFLKPDQATLSQAVKQAVRSRLGREPTASDMGDLIERLGVDYRAEYGAQVQAARAQFDATTRAIDTDAAQSAGEIQTVDPSARFAEFFESRFSNEIAFGERREELNDRQAVGRATLHMVDSIIGRG